MLIKELVEDHDGLVRYYSDAGFLVHKIGTEEYYGEAIELATSIVEYEESNIPIEVEDPGSDDSSYSEVEDMRAALEVMGVMP